MTAPDRRLSRYRKQLSGKQEYSVPEVLEVHLVYRSSAAWKPLSNTAVVVASVASIAMLIGRGRSSAQRRRSKQF